MAVRTINYEVYTLQGKRWNFHGHFDGNRREDALEEAKTVEKLPNVDGAVVVRESFSAEDMDSTESVIYHTPSMKSKPSVAAISGSKAAPAPKRPSKPAGSSSGGGNSKTEEKKATSAKSGGPKQAAKKASSSTGPNVKEPPKAKTVESEDLNIFGILVAFLMASFAGSIAAIAIYMVMKFADIFLGRNLTLGILIGVFICTFLLIFVPKLKKILAATTVKQKVVEPVVKEVPVPTDGSIEPAVSSSEGMEPIVPVSTPTKTKTMVPKPAEGVPAPSEGNKADKTVLSASKDTDDKKSPDKSAEARSQSAASDPSKKAGLSREDALAVCENTLTKIVQDARSIVGDAVTSDAYLRFGLILYLAGSNEELMHIHGLDQKQSIELLVENVKKLGLPLEQAKGFCTNIDEYLLDERYFDMYAMGRNNQIKQASERGKSNLEEAIRTWRYPEVKPQPATSHKTLETMKNEDVPERKFVAVLFTDIVNSTHSQQTKGEEWMMQVIRAHNDIIREAINRYAGHEIKHTGDGIMASFPAVVNAVEAGLAMQRGVRQFSEAMKTMAFQIRIGISAGEPIHENGDLFGTPVNMAARVMDKAGADQVAVSGIVKEMCMGKPFVFDSVGQFDLKGFEEAQTVFSVSLKK